MEQDPNLQNQEVDPQRNLVTKLINHYEPNVEVTDDYYKSISEKYQDVDTLVTKLINHYEPKSEVTKDYLNGLYGKYGVKKKEQTKPTQAAPLPGLGGVSEEPTPSPVRAPKGIKRTTEVKLPQYDSPSTVLMAHYGDYSPPEANGKYVAFPTIFPKDPDNQTSNPNDWIVAESEDQAYEIAKKRGEVLYYDTQEEAASVAEGSWKKNQSPSPSVGQLDIRTGTGALASIQPTPERKALSDYERNQKALSDIDKQIASIGSSATAVGATGMPMMRRDVSSDELKSQRDRIRSKSNSLIPEARKITDEIVSSEISDGKYLDFLTEDGTAVDPTKVGDLARKKALEYGLPDDGYFFDLVRNSIESNVESNRIKERVDKNFNDIMQEKHGMGVDEYVESVVEKSADATGITKLVGERDLAIANVYDNISTLAKNEVEKIQIDRYGKTAEDYASDIRRQYESQISAINNRYSGLMVDGQFTGNQQQFEAYKADFESISNAAQEQIDQIVSQEIKDVAAVNAKYDLRYKRQADEIARMYADKIDEKAKLVDPIIKKEIESAYKSAVGKVYEDENKDKKASEFYNVYSSFGPGAAIASFVAKPFTKSILDQTSTYLRAAGLQELSETAKLYAKSVDIGEFKLDNADDFLDPLNVLGATGQTIGGMVPTLVPSIAVGVATGGIGWLPTLAAGATGFTVESVGIAQDAYDDRFAATGSASEAEEARNKAWKAQTLILPAYALDNFPIFGKIAGGTAKRIALGALGEYGTELLQEYPQNVFEEVIRNDENLSEAMKYVSFDGFKKTASNLTPVLLIGAGGQARQISAENNIKNAAATLSAKMNIGNMTDSSLEQYMLYLTASKGSDFALAFVDAQLRTGNIAEDVAEKSTNAINNSKSFIDKTRGLKISNESKLALASFDLKIRNAKERVESETDPMLKSVEETKLKQLEKQASELATTGTTDYAVVAFKNNTFEILTPQELEVMSGNENFISSFSNGDIEVEMFGKNQKQMSDMLNEKVKQESVTETVPAKQKGRLTKFSTPQDGIVGEVTYEDGTKKELTQEEYDALEKQEGLFDVETGTQPVAEAVPAEKKQEIEEKERGFFGKILDKVFKKEKIEEDVQLTEEQKEQGIQDLYDKKIEYYERVIKEFQEEGKVDLENIYKKNLEELKSKSPKQYLEYELEILKDMPEYYSKQASKKDAIIYNKEVVQKAVDKIYQTEKLLGITATEQEVKERQDIIDSTPTEAELKAQQDTVPVAETPAQTETVQETPVEETVSAPTEVVEEAAPVELKEGEIDITTVFKNPVEKNNEQAVAASNEFKDKAGEYDEGVNDPKFKEENTTVEEISVDDIIPTQERLFEKNLKSPSEGEPLVMKIGDKYYVEDGHHRIGNEINADKQTVSVRIYESDKAKQDAIQEQAAGKVPVQPEAKPGKKMEEGKPQAEPEVAAEKGKAEVSEEEKVSAAKENLNNVWEKWKQSQNNLGVAFDPKSKANEDMELLEAFLTYIKALGIKTAKDIQKAFNDFTGGEATLDDAGAEFVSESIKEPVTKKTEKELSREVTFTNIYDIIEKVNKRTPKKANPKEVNKRAYQDAYDYLLTSDWFASATDIEQTEAIDDLKKLTGQRRESSPSAQKILGIDSTKEKISVDQKTVRGWMMKDLAEGYKLGKRDAKKVMAAMLTLKSGLQRELVAAMREIKSSGKLSKKQVDAIVNKFQKTNVFNPDAVETFLNYIQKVVDNADYVDSVKTANTTRKQIKRRMKNKDVDNNLVQAAKEFAKINPSKVDDIDAYNQLAEKIKEGLSFSMNSRQGVKFRSAFDISTVEKYSELELKRQNLASDAAFEEMFKEMYGLEERAELVNKIKELKDSITPDNKESVSKKIKEAESELEEYDRKNFGMTVSEMRDFYAELDKESEKDEVKDKETRAKQAMSSAVKVFDTYSAIINEMLESGVDPFTGEDLDIDSKTKELIKEFMDSDITKLPLKDAIRAVDALNNFVVNQTTGGLEAIVRKRRGEGNVKKLVNDGVKSFKLKIPFGSEKSFMTGFVEAYLNSFASLPNLMDNLFGGVRKGLRVEDAIGLSDVVNGRAAANTKANKVLEQFLDKFSKKEANGESFNTAANMTERGILGFMRRTVISTDEKLRKEEFERRKNLIKESIDKLAQFGDAADYEKSLIYMEAYNKLLEDSNSIEDVESKVDPVNKEAVEWWSEKFNEILPELTETSINIYNTVLENESNYNPDVFKRLNEQDPELTGLDDDSYNSSSGNEKVYDKKNPMLMRVKKPSLLPKGRYVSLDFDVNNFSAYESALVDVNTAAAIQQLKGALESEAFRQLVPDNSDRKILKERITTYVAQIRRRGYVPFGSKQWNMINDISSIFARVGTATSLGGLLQPAKQTLPVFVNTLVNSGMSPEVFKSLAYVFDKDISNAINNSGMPIANRGVASQTTMDDIGKLSDKLSESSGIKLYNGVKFMQDKWMKIFLQEPDAFIARASFLVYYKQELKRKGIDTSKIDWKNHKWNKEAANFAQRMVDRQQNVSDTDLQGLFLTDRTGASPIIRKVLLPFQNFVLNQKNRMYADIKALQYGSKEDKSIAIKSLLGLSAEWASFIIISIAIQEGMYMAAESLISQFKGEDDDEEAKKKRAKEKERRRKMYVRSVGTSAFKDFMSPAPFVDQTLITAANFALEEAGATIDKGGLQFGVDFDKKMYEEYEKEVMDISDEELKLEKSIEYLNYIIEAQKEVDGEMYDVHIQKINEFNERLQGGMEYQSRIRKDVERYMKKIEVEFKPLQLYGVGESGAKVTDMLGSVGIAYDRMDKTSEMFKQAATLEYETESFGRKTVKKIPQELQQAMYIAALAQLSATISLLPSEAASTSNKIQKLIQQEAKTESQLERERKDEIKKRIGDRDEFYKGYESGMYSSINAYSLREYKKNITELTDEEIDKVMYEMGY